MKTSNDQLGHNAAKLYIAFVLATAFTVSLPNSHAEEAERDEETVITIVAGSSLPSELSETPASVSVLSFPELNQSTPDYFDEQVLRVPNLNTAGGNSRSKFFQIRGIGELEQYEGAPNSSVALIVDDVDLTGIGAALTLFDIDQLEVHRGPQATRFGSSALAGSINLTSAAPSPTSYGSALLSFGNDELFSAGAVASGAVTETLSARFSAFLHQQDGFRDNEFLRRDDTNEREEFTGRAKFLLTPDSKSEFTLTLLSTFIDNGYDAFNIFNGFTNQSDRPGRDEERLRLASVRGVIDLDKRTELTSVSSVYRSDVDYSFDGDWGNNPFWAPFDPYDFFSDTDRQRTVFAQQFRLQHALSERDRAPRLLSGLFLQSLEEETTTSEFADNVVFDFLDSEYRAKTAALFTGVEIPIASRWSLSAGLRGEYRDASYSDSREIEFSPINRMWGGNITLEYQYAEKNLAYFTASRGFRGSGFNASPSLSADQRSFGDESLVNLELGSRFELLSGKLRGSAAAFLNFRRDQQVKLALQVDPNDPLSFTFLTDNAARGRSAGFELEGQYKPTSIFSFDFSGALLDTEIRSADESIRALEGRDQSHAPNWQYFVQANTQLRSDLLASIGVAGRDAFFFDDSHDQKSNDYHLLHAALTYTADSWDLRLWGRNLTDESYAVRGFFFGNEPPDFPETLYTQLGDPRSFGATLTYYFTG